MFEEVLAAACVKHRGLPAVGVDLVDHAVLKSFGHLAVGCGSAPAEVDARDNVALFQGIDLFSQRFQGIVVYKLFPAPLCHLPACIEGGAVDGVAADEGGPDMSGPLKNVGRIHDPRHGCDCYRRFYDSIVYEEFKTIICFHHASPSVGSERGY